MLTKLVVVILKKYDIYHTATISIKISQKKNTKTLLFSFHSFSVIVTHQGHKTDYRNGTQGHNDSRNKR